MYAARCGLCIEMWQDAEWCAGMITFDRAGIAGRLRALISGHCGMDLAHAAERLHVEELSLRMSVDDLSPHPTIEVVFAVIREYGVDPTWLLTGTYDSSSHRAAMEGDDMPGPLRDFVAYRRGSISDPPPEHFRAADQN
jgi:hypothetical protein